MYNNNFIIKYFDNIILEKYLVNKLWLNAIVNTKVFLACA